LEAAFIAPGSVTESGAMPRFFFKFVSVRQIFRDFEGSELADIDAAIVEALEDDPHAHV
jgi:hypothetical protein